NTASVTITVSGTGEDGDFTLADGTPADYTAIVAAIQAAAEAQGMVVTGVGATSLTVTWNQGDPSSFSVNLTAFNDDLLDSPEDIVLTLSGQTVSEGAATIVAGDGSAVLNITDNDAAVTFAVTVSSEATGNDTITKGGDALTGANTASVTITVSGTGEDGDFTLADGTPEDYTAIVAAIQAAAE